MRVGARGLVELAEIVEVDLWLGEGSELLSDSGIWMEIAKQAEASAMIGDELALAGDSGQLLVNGESVIGIEDKREDGRKPADGAGEVHVIGERRAAMGFHFDQAGGAAGPMVESTVESSEEEVEGGDAKGSWGVGKEGRGGSGVEGAGEVTSRPIGVIAGWVVHGKGRDGGASDLAPVREFVQEARGLGALL